MDERIIKRAVDRKRLDLIQQEDAQADDVKEITNDDLVAWGLNVETNQFDRYERDILYYIVRYGHDHFFDHTDEKAMADAGENAEMKVIEYIQWDLERDGIKFAMNFTSKCMMKLLLT